MISPAAQTFDCHVECVGCILSKYNSFRWVERKKSANCFPAFVYCSCCVYWQLVSAASGISPSFSQSVWYWIKNALRFGPACSSVVKIYDLFHSKPRSVSVFYHFNDFYSFSFQQSFRFRKFAFFDTQSISASFKAAVSGKLFKSCTDPFSWKHSLRFQSIGDRAHNHDAI